MDNISLAGVRCLWAAQPRRVLVAFRCRLLSRVHSIWSETKPSSSAESKHRLAVTGDGGRETLRLLGGSGSLLGALAPRETLRLLGGCGPSLRDSVNEHVVLAMSRHAGVMPYPPAAYAAAATDRTRRPWLPNLTSFA
jgi:hypothetical protein